ncbi:MAG: TetR/AcrR family transcriptional regulator [Pseudomonadota bacterium]
MTVDLNQPRAEKPPAEDRILAAAREEFAAKGFFGARTQAIADAAGLNKAMLHYYFRTKEILYGQVIKSALENLFSGIIKAWLMERPLPEKVEAVVDLYLDMVRRDPSLMKIILREAVDGGDRMKKIFTQSSLAPPFGPGSPIHDVLQDFGDKLGLGPTEALHIYVNIVGMCVVSYVSPMMLETLVQYDTSDFEAFLAERRKAIKAMVRAYFQETLPGADLEL